MTNRMRTSDRTSDWYDDLEQLEESDEEWWSRVGRDRREVERRARRGQEGAPTPERVPEGEICSG